MPGTIVIIVVAAVGGALLLLWVYGERWRPLRSSTWKLVHDYGLKNALTLTTLHSYVYLRWTRQYIRLALNKLLPRSTARDRKKWADAYHGKVLTHEQARRIVTLNHTIPPRDLEQIIPYPTARDLVLNGPPDIVAYECVCRNTRTIPCKPSQVCMIIGQPFADFILDHHPTTSRRLSQNEAMELLRQEHERGHLHSAWFKDVMLNRFYAICNCCKCCCGGLEAMVKYGMGNIASSGYVAQVDEASCDGCGKCERSCPFRSATTAGGTSSILWEKCMGCGVCESQCSRQAITLVRDERKGIPFDVRMMT